MQCGSLIPNFETPRTPPGKVGKGRHKPATVGLSFSDVQRCSAISVVQHIRAALDPAKELMFAVSVGLIMNWEER